MRLQTGFEQSRVLDGEIAHDDARIGNVSINRRVLEAIVPKRTSEFKRCQLVSILMHSQISTCRVELVSNKVLPREGHKSSTH